MKINKTLVFVMIFMSMFSFVSSAVVQTAVGADTYFVEYQKFEYLEIGENFEVHARVFNQTGYPLTNSSVNCTFGATYKNGTTALGGLMSFYQSPLMDELGYFYFNVPGEALTGGKSSWVISCWDGGYGGFASGEIFITESGYEITLVEIVSYIILIMTILGVLFIINNKHSKTDFKQKRKEIVSDNKNYKKTMIKGMLHGLFKNIFIWNYFLGWLIILIIDNMLLRFPYQLVSEYFHIIVNVYSLGLLLVLIFMIGFMIDFIKGVTEDISKDNWGLN